jgi:ABC-type ATPase with predicted acetyltransferase domain
MTSNDTVACWSLCVNAKTTHTPAGGGLAGQVAALLGLHKTHREVLWDRFPLTLTGGTVTAVCGPSGCGKSVLLRTARQQLGRDAITLKAITGRHRRRSAVAFLTGGTIRQRLAVLARCGLAEATALVTPAGRLSDGQQVRLQLADALHRMGLAKRPKVLIVDEFASTLDLCTAAILARQIRRLIVRSGSALLLATPRMELLGPLRPEAVILKPFGQPARMLAGPPDVPDHLPEPAKWSIETGRLSDYRVLEPYHYITGPPACHKRVYVIRPPDCYRQLGAPAVAAVLVVSPPVIAVRGRNIATAGRYVGRHRRAALARLNREVECISRVIVHPMFRGCGLAVRLVRHAIATSPLPLMESLAAMGKVHPFFELAGMSQVGLFKGRSQYYRYYLAHTPAGGLAPLGDAQ